MQLTQPWEKSKEVGDCSNSNSQKGYSTPKGSSTVRNLFSVLSEGEKEVFNSDLNETVCLSLLKAMEIEDLVGDEEEEGSIMDFQDDEMMNLPNEWTYTCLDKGGELKSIEILVGDKVANTSKGSSRKQAAVNEESMIQKKNDDDASMENIGERGEVSSAVEQQNDGIEQLPEQCPITWQVMDKGRNRQESCLSEVWRVRARTTMK